MQRYNRETFGKVSCVSLPLEKFYYHNLFFFFFSFGLWFPWNHSEETWNLRDRCTDGSVLMCVVESRESERLDKMDHSRPHHYQWLAHRNILYYFLASIVLKLPKFSVSNTVSMDYGHDCEHCFSILKSQPLIHTILVG